MKINADISKLNTQARKDKALVAIARMEKVIRSSHFKKLFIQNMVMTHGELSEWKGAHPIDIYKHFMSGAEVLQPTVDNEMDIVVDDYWTWMNVIGYTKRNIMTIYVNTRFFDKRSSKLIGSNLVHEYGHKVGFSHDLRRTKRRSFSICYLLNDTYEEAFDLCFPNLVEKETIRKKPWWKRILFWI